MAETVKADPEETPAAPTRTLAVLTLTALGIVFGDIGTSPLYALRECFVGAHGVAPTRENVLGVLSLIFWALIIVISIEYMVFVLRADNRGEGGILALIALIHPEHGGPGRPGRVAGGLLLLGLFGTALIYGDGMITPAISVLSAVEGLKVATPVFEPLVLPLTIVILVTLFLVQKRGTARVGAAFGPLTLLWFLTLGALGASGLRFAPEVLQAVNPAHAVRFFLENGFLGFLVLGTVFLVVTGGEALYADMGHFGRKPIRAAWFTIVLPALLLNYFGQGALLLADPQTAINPFYLLAPGWLLYPLVGLATVATIIASQAIISGAFSLTRQAVNLGYSPRLRIEHTSATEHGQVYMPEVNWFLMLSTVGLVLAFQSSSALVGAYGMAVTTTMSITTLLLFVVARTRWKWSWPRTIAVIGPLSIIDLAFFLANVPKIPRGGWFPLVVAVAIFTMLTTWRRGRQAMGQRLRASFVPFERFLPQVLARPPLRVPGTAVFLTGNPNAVPVALIRNLEHNKVLHEQVVLLSIATEEVPYVPGVDRLELHPEGEGFYRVIAHYGFMENPNVPNLMRRLQRLGLQFDENDVSFFLGRERMIASQEVGTMPRWREKLFEFMSRNSQRATAFFRIPPERVIEVGTQVKV